MLFSEERSLKALVYHGRKWLLHHLLPHPLSSTFFQWWCGVREGLGEGDKRKIAEGSGPIPLGAFLCHYLIIGLARKFIWFFLKVALVVLMTGKHFNFI